jgi:hypothetical protein
MKKLSFLALAAVGLLLGACTDKEVAESTKLNQYDMIEGQSAWIAVGIALPGEPVTRSNEDLYDGDAAEFDVKSAMLVLFKGASEDNATLVKEYEIADYEFNNEANDNEPDGNTLDPKEGVSYQEVSSPTQEANPSENGWYEFNGTDYILSTDEEFNTSKTYYTKVTGGKDPSKYGEVTSTSTKIVKEIESPSLGTEDNLYGYVILNYKNNATDISFAAGTKFSDFKKQVLTAIGIVDESKGYGDIKTTSGLVMTNVPISATPGGTSASTGAVTTLAKINKNAIYTSKEAAQSGASVACIYVERAAVKVQVENNVSQIELPYGVTYVAVTETTGKNPKTEGWYEETSDGKVATADETPDASKTYYTKLESTFLDVAFEGWALGNVNYNNKTTSGYYNTRQFDTEWLPYFNEKCTTNYLKYRMVGRTPFFDDGHTTAYRTYFGRDVNYTGNTGLIGAQLSDGDYILDSGDATYTYENTFSEDHQIYRNTTYVGVKVKIAGGDFYTIEGQPNTRLLESDLPNEIAKNASSTINTAIANIDAAITADLGKAASDATRQLPTSITKVTYDIVPVVDLGTRAADGSVPYTYTLQLTNVKDQSGTALDGANLAKVITLAGTNLTTEHTGTTTIYKYVGGVSYYATRIAHFGDVETPWDAPAEAYNVYDKVYPLDGQALFDPKDNYGASRAAAWLGRWGIVRNNWYLLSIDEIKGLGSPVPEDFSGSAGDTPDDNPKPKYYIAAHVHILPWAVRKQSVKF